MPLVVDDLQAKHLPADLPKMISEANYDELPITGGSWFTRQKKMTIIALGGQVNLFHKNFKRQLSAELTNGLFNSIALLDMYGRENNR